MTEPLVHVEGLRVTFDGRARRGEASQPVRAVDGIDLEIRSGETVGLVGESGCGKSSAGLALLRLVPAEGRVTLQGDDVLGADRKRLRRLRKEMQMIFQDPFSSLNPRHTVRRILREPLDVHGIGIRAERNEVAAAMLERVGLERSALDRYPHEFSGGQRQRLGIARALTVQPSFIVCDEPSSALDVSTQAQIISLLEDLQDEQGLAYLFIAHDLAVVRHVSDRVAVMYLGKIVELAQADELYADPRHPYTTSLLGAAPVPDPQVEATRRPIILRGETPDVANPPSGCRFRTRCPFATDLCAAQVPPLSRDGSGHLVACHYSDRIAAERAASSA